MRLPSCTRLRCVLRATLPLIVAALVSELALARVVRVDITRRTTVLAGETWGKNSAYEKMIGRVYFAVDPKDAHNRRVVDLDKAQSNPHGEVEFSADVYVLRPRAGGNGALLLEIPNRGSKGLLATVEGAKGSADPSTRDEFGDGFLLTRGYTVAWLGWQWDVRDEAGLMRLYAPIAHAADGSSIKGLARADWTPAEHRDEWPLAHVIAGNIGGTGYPVADPAARENVLTVRDCPTCERHAIPRMRWQFARQEADRISPSDRFVRLDGGFQPGKLYELVYVVKDPVVVGLGLAAVRDFVSYAKYAPDAIVHVDRALALGISQDGRFLRHFLWQDFNADESGRKVFDGVLSMVAGAGRGSFNHRFAQPSRDAETTSSLFYPTDLFPFTDLPETDPVLGQTAGLLDAPRRSATTPRIFFVNTSHEYWQRAASLIHTNVTGSNDMAESEDVRIYLAAGQGHFPAPFPPQVGSISALRGQQKANPMPRKWLWRALITDMDQWVNNGTLPPPSAHPQVSDRTLVALHDLAFPHIPGVRLPVRPLGAYRLDFGPEWQRGIITSEPPKVGAEYTVLLPQVDEDGNERSGIQLPELQVPLATYTGWNLRDASLGMPDYTVPFVGSYIPFAKTAEERKHSGDPRLSIAERYVDADKYMRLYREAAERLVKDRFLLPEDVTAVLELGIKEWKYATSHEGSSSAP
jgi:Alpha/beta hydrolase domain